MRLGSPSTSRADYYDRNPAKKTLIIGVAPGSATRASTIDATYTVPAGKKAYLEFLHVRASARTATALNALARTTIQYQPNGGAGQAILISELYTGQASTNDGKAAAGAGLLAPGDQVAVTTRSDNNAAGSDVTLDASVIMTEFDA